MEPIFEPEPWDSRLLCIIVGRSVLDFGLHLPPWALWGKHLASLTSWSSNEKQVWDACWLLRFQGYSEFPTQVPLGIRPNLSFSVKLPNPSSAKQTHQVGVPSVLILHLCAYSSPDTARGWNSSNFFNQIWKLPDRLGLTAVKDFLFYKGLF